MRIVQQIVKQFNRNDSLLNPQEGIFWLVDGTFYAFTEPVNNFMFCTLSHKDEWFMRDVQFDYYPRGRVMVNPSPIHKNLIFDCFIYLDDCINNDEIINVVKHTFHLDRCNIKYIGSKGAVTEDHYQCHKCKSKKEDENVLV